MPYINVTGLKHQFCNDNSLLYISENQSIYRMSISLLDRIEMLKGEFKKGNRDDHGSLHETE